MNELQNFDWRNQQVIVTGGSGFLGAHLVQELQVRGAGAVIVPRKKTTICAMKRT